MTVKFIILDYYKYRVAHFHDGYGTWEDSLRNAGYTTVTYNRKEQVWEMDSREFTLFALKYS